MALRDQDDMTDTDTILERIRTGLAKHGRKKLVRDATGIDAAVLSRVGRPDWNPTADTMRRLDAAIGQLFPANQPDTSHQPE